MKMKLKEHNGAITLIVSGTKQQLIITEEDGCFAIEVASMAHNIPASASASAPAPAYTPAPTSAPASAFTPTPAPEEEHAPHMPPPTDEALFKRLVLLRKSLSAANEVPPYLIFHDKTLHEMVDKMPMDMQAMSHISGVGMAKLEKYGPLFLDVINGAA